MRTIHSDKKILQHISADLDKLIIRGRSGSGKTYLLNQLLAERFKNHAVLMVHGYPTSQNSFSCLYQGIATFLNKGYIEDEQLFLLIKRYTRLLPYFGKHLAAILEVDKHEAYKSYISKTGLPFGVSPSVHICNLLKEISLQRKIVVVYEDAQWVDNSSWELIDYISNDSGSSFPFLLVFNDKTETWLQNWDARINSLRIIQEKEDLWSSIELTNWPKKKMPRLVNEILNNPSSLSSTFLDKLYEKSDGLPFFVRSILINLIGKGLLVKETGKYVTKGNWIDLEIDSNLKAQILERIEKVYSEIENSQTLLEVASVLGDPFDFNQVDVVSSTTNSQQVFLRVAKQFKLLEYLFMERKWSFDHSQTRIFIYKSLGQFSREIHLKVAEALVKNTSWTDFIQVSFHFQKAGRIDKSVDYKLKEINRLVSIGLSAQALELSDELEKDTEGLILTDQQANERVYLKASCYFWNRKFPDALVVLRALMNKLKGDLLLRAKGYHLLGKTFGKLDTDGDFKSAVHYLNKSIDTLSQSTNTEGLMGGVFSDLVVAHAHRNQFDLAHESYIQAERLLNVAGDRLGLARLQRRCIIFMEPEVSAPILKKLETIFLNHDVHHERVMSLVNAASQYIVIGQFESAFQILNKAHDISQVLMGFGTSYIYNNLGIIHLAQDDFQEAERAFDEARKGTSRAVEQLILDINEAALFLIKEGAIAALPMLTKALDKARNTSELAYITPAALNYALACIQFEDFPKAFEILNEIALADSNHYWNANYHKAKRLDLLRRAYSELNSDEEQLKQLNHEYEKAIQRVGESKFSECDATLIRFQFWSD